MTILEILESFAGKVSAKIAALYAKKTDIPTSLPANGGNAATVNGHSVNADVPAGAVFTDTKAWGSITGKPSTFPPATHTHGNGDITGLDASKLTGTIDIARLPQGALERLAVVANDTARFALTKSNIQTGDTVKVTATGKMYFVVDDAKLNTEAGYEVYTAGTATAVPWSGVTDKPSSFTPSSHSHTWDSVTGKPSSYTPSSHTHTKAQVTDFPAALKNPAALNIQLNGSAAASYDGSAAKTVNITLAALGLDEITDAEIDAIVAGTFKG